MDKRAVELQKPRLARGVARVSQELVVVWRLENGTHCALFDIGEAFELRVVRQDVIVRQQRVTDLWHALYVLARTWELEQLTVPLG